MNPEADKYLDKIVKYCAYQERCIKEVLTKLNTYEISDTDKKEILNYLTDNKFVNNERFANCFVRSKINQKAWGTNKIRYSLRSKGIDEKLIQDALAEIDQEQYSERLKKVLQAKKIHEKDPYKRKLKLAQYAIQKGFEPTLVWKTIKEMEEC
jgi:Uncharacterized protein conserved in bacteria